MLSGSAPVVRFASFQDLYGKSPDGQVKAHNGSIHLTDWDGIVLDEYHFGVWRDSARELYAPTDRELAEVEQPEEPQPLDHPSVARRDISGRRFVS